MKKNPSVTDRAGLGVFLVFCLLGAIQVGKYISLVQADMTLTAMVLQALILLLAGLLLTLLSRQALRKLLARMEFLAVSADQIRGDRTERLPENGDDEVGRVIRAINRLLERIEQQNQEQANALYAAWMQQAEQLKTVYPGFDLATELQSEQFRALLRSNVPVQTAYEVVHKDEIIPAAMRFTAEKIQEKTVNSIRAGQRRPAEGAMASQGAVQIKSDVSQLTKADREEIARRVARGEKIRF